MPGMTVEQLRQELPITHEAAYFQTGMYGPATDPVLKVVRKRWKPKPTMGRPRPPENSCTSKKKPPPGQG